MHWKVRPAVFKLWTALARSLKPIAARTLLSGKPAAKLSQIKSVARSRLRFNPPIASEVGGFFSSRELGHDLDLRPGDTFSKRDRTSLPPPDKGASDRNAGPPRSASIFFTRPTQDNVAHSTHRGPSWSGTYTGGGSGCPSTCPSCPKCSTAPLIWFQK